MGDLIVFLGSGIGLVISGFLIVVSILWLFVPFKIFAMKKNSDLILEHLTGNVTNVPKKVVNKRIAKWIER